MSSSSMTSSPPPRASESIEELALTASLPEACLPPENSLSPSMPPLSLSIMETGLTAIAAMMPAPPRSCSIREIPRGGPCPAPLDAENTAGEQPPVRSNLHEMPLAFTISRVPERKEERSAMSVRADEWSEGRRAGLGGGAGPRRDNAVAVKAGGCKRCRLIGRRSVCPGVSPRRTPRKSADSAISVL
jgi:hypothetical protein